MAVFVAGCGSGTRAAPAVVRVTPASGLYDVSRSIVVSHLAAGEVGDDLGLNAPAARAVVGARNL